MNESREQLRRLKNTLMGASNRLSLVARSGQMGAGASSELNEVAAELASAARRLERLIGRLPIEG